MSEQRTEGWGSCDNIRGNAHYFEVNGRSLCRRVFALGAPRWERNQELGTEATPGTCKACWRIRAKAVGATGAQPK